MGFLIPRDEGASAPAPAQGAPAAEQRAPLQIPSNEVTPGGVGKAFATGARSGAEGTVGAIGSVSNWQRDKVRKLMEWLGASPEEIEAVTKGVPTLETMVNPLGAVGVTPWSRPPSTEQVAGATDAAVNALPESVSGPVQDVTRHKAANVPEELAQTAGSFLPNALTPGGPFARIANVLFPAAATEGVGQATRKLAPEWEDTARFVAGILSSGATSAGIDSFKTRSALRKIGTNPAAAKRAEQLLIEQGMSPEDAAAKMREFGGEATLPDVSTTARQEAQRIQARGGKGRATIESTLRPRNEASGARLEEDLKTVMGPQQDRGLVEQALADRLSTKAAEQRGSHSAQTQPIDLQPLLDDIDTRLATEKGAPARKALQDVRDMLHVKKTAPGQPDVLETASETVLSTRQAVRDMLYDANGQVKQGIGPHQKQLLQDLYAKLNESIDPANPTLRQVDKDIEQISKEKRAIDVGRDMFDTDKGATPPAEFERTYNAMTPGEQSHLLSGANQEMWRRIGVTDRERSTLQKILSGEGKWNYEKVKTVVGPEKAQKLLNALQREDAFTETYNKVVQGSKTAETVSQGGGEGILADVADVGLATAGGGPGAGGMVALRKAGKYSREGLAKLMRSGDIDQDVAKLLMSQNPDDIVRATQILKQRKSLVPPALLGGIAGGQSGGGY